MIRGIGEEAQETEQSLLYRRVENSGESVKGKNNVEVKRVESIHGLAENIVERRDQ